MVVFHTQAVDFLSFERLVLNYLSLEIKLVLFGGLASVEFVH